MPNDPKEMTVTIAQADRLKQKWEQQNMNKHINDRISFADFLSTVNPVFGGDGAITVPWCGMHLCIEKDGYTHS